MEFLRLLFRVPARGYFILVTPMRIARVIKLAPVVAAWDRSPEIALAIVRPDSTRRMISPRATPKGPPITCLARFWSIN